MANVDLRAIKHNHPLFTLGQCEKRKALQIKTTNFQIANQFVYIPERGFGVEIGNTVKQVH